ncbi:hypothetical protein [Micromonospora chersina]|uniref:hypothetical protein n=1 Tax=Micromonospora chersina TaxID=47854 RepID=UPI003717340C
MTGADIASCPSELTGADIASCPSELTGADIASCLSAVTGAGTRLCASGEAGPCGVVARPSSVVRSAWAGVVGPAVLPGR